MATKIKIKLLFLYSRIKYKRKLESNDIPYISICAKYPKTIVIGSADTVKYYKNMGKIFKKLGLSEYDF